MVRIREDCRSHDLPGAKHPASAKGEVIISLRLLRKAVRDRRGVILFTGATSPAIRACMTRLNSLFRALSLHRDRLADRPISAAAWPACRTTTSLHDSSS
jgi:hypothetical protein